jgi:HAD superfamily hydrolase (TIGR01509 family)
VIGADAMNTAADASAQSRAAVPAPTLAAALFDWDGTLVDSRALLLGAWRDSTLHVLGRSYPVTAAEEHAVFTLPGAQIWPELARDDEQRRALAASFQEAYDRHADGLLAFAGVREMLEGLRAGGVSIAVVTSKARRRYGPDASRAGLEGLIDLAVCAEDASRAKPDPAPVLRALELLGVPGAHAIMAGDTAVDMAAGAAAGTRTLGVAWGHAAAADLLAAGAEAVAQDPAELLAIVLGYEWRAGAGPARHAAGGRVA